MSFLRFVYHACSHFGLSTPRQLKISFMKTFMQTYLVQQRLERKGSCNNGVCARDHCCKNCDWLVRRPDGWFCKNWKQAPQMCKDFPLFEKELENIGVKGKCGFYWGEKAK